MEVLPVWHSRAQGLRTCEPDHWARAGQVPAALRLGGRDGYRESQTSLLVAKILLSLAKESSKAVQGLSAMYLLKHYIYMEQA